MSDFREAAADRFERAADRIYNSGFLEEERGFRDAAAQIRAGLSLEETQALEQRMLSGQKPRLLNRLTALAAQGEYDGTGSDDTGSGASAASDAADSGPILTDSESGANQLLSTAPPNGLSDPYATAQAGWLSGSPDINWYTLLTTATDNPNPYTTGDNVNPFTGDQNTESFTGGGGSAQSPQPTGTGWAAFGVSGPPPSMLASPDLLAQLDAPANTNVATDANAGAPVGTGSLMVNGAQWAWTNFVPMGDGVYNRFDSPDGTTIAFQPTGGGPVVLVDASDGSVIGAYTTSGAFVPAPVDVGRAAPGTPPPADFVPDPDETNSTNTQSAAGPGAALNTQLTPAQEAQLNDAIQQAVGPNTPSAVNPGPPPNINDVMSGTDGTSPGAGGNQPSDQGGSQQGESTSQQDEENWSAAKSGMWDAGVDMAQGLLKASLVPALGPLALFGPLQPSLDWAKSGPPAPTGDPVRDAQLLDNYQSGGWVTRVVAMAAPIGGEGILDAALSGATDISGLGGFGGGGGDAAGTFGEEWMDATFSEKWANGGGAAFEQAARDNAAATGGFVPSWALTPESQAGWSGADTALTAMSPEELQLVDDVLNAPEALIGRSGGIEGQGKFTLDNWLLTNDVQWTQGLQDVYDKALYLRAASGLPVNVMAGGGYTLGEVTAAEAGASTSGVFNIPYWPDFSP